MIQSPALAKMLGQLKVKNAAAEARSAPPAGHPPAVAAPAHPAPVHEPAQPGPAIPVSQRPPHGAPISRMKAIAKPPVGHEKQSPGGLKAIASIHQAMGADRGGQPPPPPQGAPSLSTLQGGTGPSPLKMHDGGVVPAPVDPKEEVADEPVRKEGDLSKKKAAESKRESTEDTESLEQDAGPKKPLKLQTGGVVPGKGNRDTVDAKLTPGELVIPKDAAQKMVGAGAHQLSPRDQELLARAHGQHLAQPGPAPTTGQAPTAPPGQPGGEAGPAPGIMALLAKLGHVAGQPIVPQGAGTQAPDGGVDATEDYRGTLGGSNPRRMRDGTK